MSLNRITSFLSIIFNFETQLKLSDMHDGEHGANCKIESIELIIIESKVEESKDNAEVSFLFEYIFCFVFAYAICICHNRLY